MQNLTAQDHKSHGPESKANWPYISFSILVIGIVVIVYRFYPQKVEPLPLVPRVFITQCADTIEATCYTIKPYKP